MRAGVSERGGRESVSGIFALAKWLVTCEVPPGTRGDPQKWKYPPGHSKCTDTLRLGCNAAYKDSTNR